MFEISERQDVSSVAAIFVASSRSTHVTALDRYFSTSPVISHSSSPPSTITPVPWNVACIRHDVQLVFASTVDHMQHTSRTNVPHNSGTQWRVSPTTVQYSTTLSVAAACRRGGSPANTSAAESSNVFSRKRSKTGGSLSGPSLNCP